METPVRIFDPEKNYADPRHTLDLDEAGSKLRSIVNGFLNVEPVEDSEFCIVTNEEAQAEGQKENHIATFILGKMVYGIAVMIHKQFIPNHMKV